MKWMLTSSRRLYFISHNPCGTPSRDARKSAQFEHTIAVTRDGAHVLTLRPGEALAAPRQSDEVLTGCVIPMCR